MMGPDALGRLLDAHAAGLTLYARQWCVAPEDAVQEAFLKLAARRDSPPDAVAWLYAVTRNLRGRPAGRSAAAAITKPWPPPVILSGLPLPTARAWTPKSRPPL